MDRKDPPKKAVSSASSQNKPTVKNERKLSRPQVEDKALPLPPSQTPKEQFVILTPKSSTHDMAPLPKKSRTPSIKSTKSKLIEPLNHDKRPSIKSDKSVFITPLDSDKPGGFYSHKIDDQLFKTIILSPKSSLKPEGHHPPEPKKPDKPAAPPIIKTVILTPKESKKPEEHPKYKTVVLSPTSSVKKPLKTTSEWEHDLKKFDDPDFAKLMPHRKKPTYRTVILSPRGSPLKPRKLPSMKSSTQQIPPPTVAEPVEQPPPRKVHFHTEVLLEQVSHQLQMHPHQSASSKKKSAISMSPHVKFKDDTDPANRSELDMAETILAMISEGNPKERFLNQLKAFDIPDQKKLLRYLLEGDLHSFDFGGLMRKYYSYALRSYTLVNMQDNYREPYTFSTCFAPLDVSKIGSKAEEQQKDMSRKLKQRDEKQEDLRFVAVDDEHFTYLKQLANDQPTTIPLTVLKGLAGQALPILLDTYRTYARSLTNKHPCTKIACAQYLRMKSRVNLYIKMDKSGSASES